MLGSHDSFDSTIIGRSAISLFQGDCLELMQSIPSASVDMILCDLPYGTTQCEWDSVIPFEPLWQEYERIIKDNGAIVLFAVNQFSAVLACSNLPLFKYEIIWEKTSATGFLNASRQPLRAHENILVFYKNQPTYNPQKTLGHERKTTSRTDSGSAHYGSQNRMVAYDSTERFPRSVQQFSSDKQLSSLHPTQKPVGLCEWLIRTYTNPGDTVMDNCMGSGTTGIACINTGRNFIGMEQDAKYFSIAEERILITPKQLSIGAF